LTQKEREQLDKNINLAKQLGIQFRIITNYDMVKAIVDFALKENITHIIVGKPRVRNVLSMLRLGNFVNRLIRYSGNIDVYILGSDRQAKDHFREKAKLPSFTANFAQYLITSASVLLAAIICFVLKDFIGYQVVSFCLLFLVSTLAFFFGTGPILLAATLSAVIWDFFFIPPPFTLHIENPVDVLMLIMFFIIALLNGILTSRVRGQEKKIRIREERTHALYQLTRELTLASGIDEVLKIARKSIQRNFNLDCSIILKNELNQLEIFVRHDATLKLLENERSIAMWVFKHSIKAGKHTDTLPSTDYTFYPLTGNSGNMGVIAVLHVNNFTQGEAQFWEAYISQISGKFEREFLREAAKSAFILNESDKLYKTLFNSISHELRIPVATIMGASDSLLNTGHNEAVRTELSNEILKASERLNRLIENLLSMSRLESGRITPRIDWCDVHDLVNMIIDNLRTELEPFNLMVVIPDNMPLVKLDFGLMEQVLHNLVYNSCQYAAKNTSLRIKTYYDHGNFILEVMDRGPGFPKEALPFIFNKFYRVEGSKTGGTGLGLSIVKGFVEAQKGSVAVENRQHGGARFTIKIPSEIPEIENIPLK
jgi:two-component system sensor histidine kinase KdpD